MNQIELFQIEPAQIKKTCACGVQFIAKESRVKWCSRKCAVKHYAKHHYEILKQRYDLVKHFDMPALPGSEKHQDVIDYYTKQKFGISVIGRLCGMHKQNIRRILIMAGVYHPEHKYNGYARKGQGKDSRFLIEAKRKQREELEKEKRHMIAVCLWGMRKGIGIETTVKQNGWNKGRLWNWISVNPWYKVMTSKRILSHKDSRLTTPNSWSKLYPLESSFCDHIEDIFKQNNIQYIREPVIEGIQARADFKVYDTLIECKVLTKRQDAYVLLGQIMLYKTKCQIPIALVPTDVTFKEDLKKLLIQNCFIETDLTILNRINRIKLVDSYKRV